MQKQVKAAAVCLLLLSGPVMAASPIPTFDKEAVTDYPYQRTGQQAAVVDTSRVTAPGWQSGNTGTAEKPAFYVARIQLEGLTLPDEAGKLRDILAAYSGRSVQVGELQDLTEQITEYGRIQGYTVPQAVIPPQEVENGVLTVRIYAAAYAAIGIVKNESDVADRVLEGYLHELRPGDTIQDRPLELAINNLNDLPGVTARAVMEPGTQQGTTKVGIEVLRRPVWNNYVFADNGGGYYSGRYRYGFNTEINNPSHQGDKFILNGILTSHDLKSYGVRYETPVGDDGTRLGIAYSKTNYELYTNILYDTLGESKGLSVYGMTPLYRDRSNRITAIYGYDHRDITDKLRLHFGLPALRTDKKADVWHAGISGSQYGPNQFTQYSFIYWHGDIDTDGGAYYDGIYHKLTSDLLSVWYDGKYNYRVMAHGQLANRPLDGSEQFYLGGMNGIRAYGSSEGYGDGGYQATFEIRRQTGVDGLEAAVFTDGGGVWNKALRRNGVEHLYGWGVGLRYTKEGDWNAQLDYARKIDGRPDWSEPKDHDGRLWFQVYKLF